MTETLEERSRRKFLAGVIDQGAVMLGGLAGGVIVASVVAPIVAAIIGSTHISQLILMLIAAAGLSGGVVLVCAALYFKGLAKQMDDDQLSEMFSGRGG